MLACCIYNTNVLSTQQHKQHYVMFAALAIHVTIRLTLNKLDIKKLENSIPELSKNVKGNEVMTILHFSQTYVLMT